MTYKEAVKKNHWGITVGLLIGLILTLFLSFSASGTSPQLGGWLSSKLFALTGNPDSQILFDRNGAADTFLVFTSSPSVVTGSATGATYTSGLAGSGTVTLHGTVSSLNTLPSADVGFRYGNTAATMTTNTSTVHVTNTGAYSIGVAGLDQTLPLYYQAIGVSDGVAYGIGDVFVFTRAISSFGGYDNFLLVVPLFVWLALIFAMGVLIWSGIKDIQVAGFGNTDIVNTALMKMAIAMILMVVAILMFQLVPEAIQRIRII